MESMELKKAVEAEDVAWKGLTLFFPEKVNNLWTHVGSSMQNYTNMLWYELYRWTHHIPLEGYGSTAGLQWMIHKQKHLCSFRMGTRRKLYSADKAYTA